MTHRRLADDIELAITYMDSTRFGGLLSGRLGAWIASRAEEVFVHWREHGGSMTISKSEELLARLFDGPLSELHRDGVLLDEVLYPPAEAIAPEALVVSRDRRELFRFELGGDVAARDLARWLGDWASHASRPSGPAGSLFDALDSAAAFTSAPSETIASEANGIFVGHATVALGRKDQRVLVDPYLLPRSTTYPAEYQPVVASELGPLAAACVTHTHPDHFSPGSLLKLGAHTKIVVPRVDRESALSVAMAARLVELGFDNVTELGWHEEIAVGGARITALPFYGEQATTGARRYPDVRNQGNVYLVEIDGERYLTVADSGRDSAGEAIRLAEELRAKVGPIDVLFGGYRAFPQYPLEYLGSSVPEYLLFVPREAWGQRQKIMYDADELVDLAESWRARHVVPYACGGAPWYWQRGLGPQADAIRGQEQSSRSDPVPEDVTRAADFRTGSADDPRSSPVDVVVLRPGDGFRLNTTRVEVVRSAPHVWPFGEPQPALVLDSEGPDIDSALLGGTRESSHWIQLNVAVIGTSDAERRDNAWRMLRRVVPVIVDLKSEGLARSFFFQWKPPGYRLRVEITPPAEGDATLKDRVSTVFGRLSFELERARSIGAVASFAHVVYEPELRIFGGAQAMNEVHHLFDVDTTLYIERLALSRSTMFEPLADDTLWLAFVLNDLVSRAVGDTGEAWDVFRSLLTRHGIDPEPGASRLPEDGIRVSFGERAFLTRYREEHHRFADAITALSNTGKLDVGVRELLANVVQFQLNRHQVEPHDQHAILHLLEATHRPTSG